MMIENVSHSPYTSEQCGFEENKTVNNNENNG